MLFVLLPRKANFTQMGIYGNYCEKYHTSFQIEFCYPTFSMANLKSLLYNAYIMNRFFCHVGFPSKRCGNRVQSQARLSFAEVEQCQRR